MGVRVLGVHGHHRALVLVALEFIELGYDSVSGDPGALANPGAFRDLLSELLTEKLAPLLETDLDVPDLDRVVLGSFSGGYNAAALIAQAGGVELHEIDLYDSLYGNMQTFEAWLQADIASFDGSTEGRRFVDVYSASAGTSDNSQELAALVTEHMTAAGLASQMLDDGTTEPLQAEDHAVIFKYASGTTVDVPRTYFGALARASGFAPLTP